MKIKINRSSYVYMVLLFLLSDVLALLIAFLISVQARALYSTILFPIYWKLFPFVFIIVLLFFLFHLYPATGISPADEIRKIVSAISLVVMIMGALSFVLREGWQYSRFILFLFWLLSVLLVPFGRYIARGLGVRIKTWGVPVVILSNCSKGYELTEALRKNRKAGFRPVAHLTPQHEVSSSTDLITGPYSLAADLQKQIHVTHAILVFPLSSGQELADLVDEFCFGYQKLYIVLDILSQTNLWVTPLDIVGNLGLEINQSLLSRREQFLKRLFDLTLAIGICMLVFPFMCFVTLAIRIDSSGSALYLQKRVGKDGRSISMYKFRTMFPDAETRLEELLKSNDALRKEWQQHQKLKHDPRITRVGKWLRRWSIDELPQIFNVLNGQMSLIGPRPMMFEQEEVYGRDLNLYKRVRPGLTGLWQVSGRSSTTFHVRATLDAYYVRNWSIWLDLYILAKTPLVILNGDGAT